MPATLPIALIVTASARNWTRMSRCAAPTARRTPISRVRSATAESSTFITPIPPTMSEIPVIAPMNSLNSSIACCTCATRSARFATVTRSFHVGP